MHQDLRMTDVGRKNHTLNFTGYSNIGGDWNFGRSIDNSTLLFALRIDEGGYRLYFDADNKTLT